MNVWASKYAQMCLGLIFVLIHGITYSHENQKPNWKASFLREVVWRSWGFFKVGFSLADKNSPRSSCSWAYSSVFIEVLHKLQIVICHRTEIQGASKIWTKFLAKLQFKLSPSFQNILYCGQKYDRVEHTVRVQSPLQSCVSEVPGDIAHLVMVLTSTSS